MLKWSDGRGLIKTGQVGALYGRPSFNNGGDIKYSKFLGEINQCHAGKKSLKAKIFFYNNFFLNGCLPKSETVIYIGLAFTRSFAGVYIVYCCIK